MLRALYIDNQFIGTLEPSGKTGFDWTHNGPGRSRKHSFVIPVQSGKQQYLRLRGINAGWVNYPDLNPGRVDYQVFAQNRKTKKERLVLSANCATGHHVWTIPHVMFDYTLTFTRAR